jgi:hypothetical protein
MNPTSGCRYLNDLRLNTFDFTSSRYKESATLLKASCKATPLIASCKARYLSAAAFDKAIKKTEL